MAQQVWSTVSPEYGSLHWLRRELAVRLGFPADGRLLDRPQRAYVDSIIESAVMQFSTGMVPDAPPDTPPGEGREGIQIEAEKEAKRRAPYRWSFLNKVEVITLHPAQDEYDLPSDFGSFHGEPTTDREGGRIAIVQESHLRQLAAADPQSGFPRYCTTRKVVVSGSSRPQTKLILYPTPDSSGSISVEYGVVPRVLDEDHPFPPGGAEHAETLLSYCFYVQALRTGEGLDIAITHLRSRMAASVVLDRAASKPTSDGVWVDDDGRFNKRYLMRMIGRHLGYGPNPKAYSHQQTQLVAEVLRRTLRRVYNPPLLPGEAIPHDWSFLRPLAMFSTLPGEHIYQLPTDFASLDGNLAHATEGAVLYNDIQVVGENMLRSLLQKQQSSARPERAAIRIVQHDNATGPRYELLLWPVPDEVYQINYRYRVNPNSVEMLPVSSTDLDIHGSDRYSEMFLEAAMLSADEIMGVKRSEHLERFMRAVQAAVGLDRNMHSPTSRGYNRDMSDDRGEIYDRYRFDAPPVTYNGVSY